MLKDFIFLFDREIAKLQEEIAIYQKEENLWKVDGHVTNSAGSLCLHLCGNLKFFIGKHIGGYDYTRDRNFEFSGMPVDRVKLISEIEETKTWVTKSLEGLSQESLTDKFPIQPFPRDLTYQNFLMHLHGHLNYHLGQINYHRRLLD